MYIETKTKIYPLRDIILCQTRTRVWRTGIVVGDTMKNTRLPVRIRATISRSSTGDPWAHCIPRESHPPGQSQDDLCRGTGAVRGRWSRTCLYYSRHCTRKTTPSESKPTDCLYESCKYSLGNDERGEGDGSGTGGDRGGAQQVAPTPRAL